MRTGHVVETRGTMARISTSKVGPCEGCNEKGSCQPSFGSPAAILETVEAWNRAHARVGDTVEIDLEGHAELRVSLLVWLAPVVGLIAGAGLAAAWSADLGLGRDMAAALGGVIGIAISYAVLTRIDRRAAEDTRLIPAVKRVIERPSAHRVLDAPRAVRVLRCETDHGRA